MKIDRVLAISTTTAALLVAAALLRPETALAVPPAAPVAVTATPLPLDRGDPARTRLGDLVFKGALQLRSTDPRFGGISGLRHAGGTRFLAITDTGNWLAFDTVETGGRLTGIADVVMAPIRQQGGAFAATKARADAEALEFDPATGAATVVYEQDHRLAHFSGIDPRRPDTLARAPDRIERLTQMTGWPLNGGGEAVAVLAPAIRIVIAEDALRADGAHMALLTRAGTTTEIGIPGVPGHRPTDAVALDATHILVLHRRFTLAMGIGAALTLVDLDNPGAARTIARWQPPLTLDNMEGLARRRDGDRTFLYLVSDDNLNSLQRTLLLKFELVPPARDKNR